MDKIWYVEVTKRTSRFGYVRAATRQEAIEVATRTDGDVDGLTQHVDDWSVDVAYEFKEKDSEESTVKIL